MPDNILILGGDGYLGWSLALAFASRTEHNIILVDNLIKRRWEQEVGSRNLVELGSPDERVRAYKRLSGRSNLAFEKVDLTNYEASYRVVKDYRPTVIVNASQQPSAPFSMISAAHASITFETNLNTNLNIIWAIAKIDKDIKYIKLGSAGCFLGVDADFVPAQKVDLSFTQGSGVFRVLNSWLPMQATDFYHQSKIYDFLCCDLGSQIWDLKIITVQQSTIFGATIPENASPETHALSTRFNYDHIFGTVINRFVCQAALDHPLTVYGDGNQKTGIISLNETVANFLRLLDLPIERGQHFVEYNYTHKLSVNEIASILQGISPGLSIRAIDNPRVEPTSVLTKRFECSPRLAHRIDDYDKLVSEFRQLQEFTNLYKSNIDPRIILPSVSWRK
jgi:UDP-sulfoquinovose synthase